MYWDWQRASEVATMAKMETMASIYSHTRTQQATDLPSQYFSRVQINWQFRSRMCCDAKQICTNDMLLDGRFTYFPHAIPARIYHACTEIPIEIVWKHLLARIQLNFCQENNNQMRYKYIPLSFPYCERKYIDHFMATRTGSMDGLYLSFEQFMFLPINRERESERIGVDTIACTKIENNS